MSLVLIATAASQAADPISEERKTGVIDVTSQYVPGHYETGTGIVVSYSNRLFLLTCAHLTGGAEPTLSGAPLAQVSRGRRTDAFNDIDLIELDPTKFKSQAFATFRPYDPKQTPEGANPLSYGDPGTAKMLGVFEVNPAALQEWDHSGGTSLSVEATRPNQKPAQALIPPWADRHLTEKAAANIEDKRWSLQSDDLFRADGPAYSQLDGSIWAPARIAPGMSCAPLLRKPVPTLKWYGQTQLQVKGMGIEFKNGMDGSRFASDLELSTSFNAYLAGERGNIGASSWKFQNGLPYLDLGKGRAEIIPAGTPAGNGNSTPPGNGNSTPPGNGNSTPPGRSTELSAQTEPVCSPSKKDESGWKKVGSPPAALWDGKPVIGFSITLRGQSSPDLLYPDHSGIDYRLKSESYASSIENVPLGAPLLSWFDRKLKMTSNNYEVRFGSSYSKLKAPVIDRTPQGLDVTLYGPSPAHEKIHFKLNPKGALLDQSNSDLNVFDPVIEVKGSSGQYYTVDLTGLFFSNADSEYQPADAVPFIGLPNFLNQPGLSEAQKLHDIAALSSEQRGQALSISYRPKCSDAEIHFQSGYAHVVHNDPVTHCRVDEEKSQIENNLNEMEQIDSVLKQMGKDDLSKK